MINNELILKFSNEKYYTKQEVQREMRLPSVDKIWEDILLYRSQFFKPLSLKHITNGRLNLCLTPCINKKVSDFERSLYQLMLQYSKAKSASNTKYFEHSQLKEILLTLQTYYHSEKDENLIEGLIKNELSLIPPSFFVSSGYLKNLINIRDNVNEEISDICLGNYYSSLIGNSELIEFYRTKEIVNSYNKVLIDKVYIGIPSKLIEENMDKMFDFIKNSDLSLFLKAGITLYYFYYIHPFEYYSEEISILLFKKILSFYGIDELASYLNFEKLLLDKENLELSLAVSQKNLDLTYFIEYLLKVLTPIIKETLDNLIVSKNKILKEEIYVHDEDKTEKEVVNHIEINEKPVEIVKQTETLNYSESIAINNIPSGLNDLDAKRLEAHLREMNPSLSKGQCYFYSRHCTLGMSYTISQYKKEVGCAYETARTSMDNLVNLGYYRKEMLRNKFIYTPVKKY